MSLNTRRLQPNMTYSALVNALNENMSLIENYTRTQIFSDIEGVPRIIIGQLPDGTQGIVVSKAGVDVTSLFT